MPLQPFFSYICVIGLVLGQALPSFGQAKELPEMPVRLISVSKPMGSESTFDRIRFIHKVASIDSDFFRIQPVMAAKNQGQDRVFQIYYQGIPLQNGLIHWLNGSSGKEFLTVPECDFTNAPEVGNSRENRASNLVWIVENKIWNLHQRVERHEAQPVFISQTEFYDGNGTFSYVSDALRRVADSPDSLVRAAVYRPDPSSRLQMTYGGPLRDRADSNSVLLTQALDTVYFRVDFSADTFRLRNDYFQMGEFSLPDLIHAKPTNPDFCYTRDDPRFEEANAFYHLNRFRGFIDSLGFSGLAQYPLKVDVHGMDGLDQSAYSPVLDILSFGDGNVDDAEDAAVMVHEYGHVLAHSALPSGNSGMERRSTEEGICDYLAGSYARTLSDWEWQRLFKWDAWNEFLPGRNLLSTKHYPENLVGQIHKDGEIFSSALMHIELALGRKKTHELLLKSLDMMVPNISMSQAAFFFLETDSLLFGGANTVPIVTAFSDRGISPYSIIVSTEGKAGNQRPGAEVRFRMHSSLLNWQSDLPLLDMRILDVQGRVLRQYGYADCGDGSVDLSLPNPGHYLIQYQTEEGWNRQPLLINP